MASYRFALLVCVVYLGLPSGKAQQDSIGDVRPLLPQVMDTRICHQPPQCSPFANFRPLQTFSLRDILNDVPPSCGFCVCREGYAGNGITCTPIPCENLSWGPCSKTCGVGVETAEDCRGVTRTRPCCIRPCPANGQGGGLLCCDYEPYKTFKAIIDFLSGLFGL